MINRWWHFYFKRHDSDQSTDNINRWQLIRILIIPGTVQKKTISLIWS